MKRRPANAKTAAVSPKRLRSGGRARVLATAALALAPATEDLRLLTLGEGLVRATFLRRPSARNKSPYVGDVRLECGSEAIAHMPAMDMGGKCIAGAEVLLKTSTDKKGQPISADAVGKFGTPKCQFSLQLLRCVEPENKHLPPNVDGGAGGCASEHW